MTPTADMPAADGNVDTSQACRNPSNHDASVQAENECFCPAGTVENEIRVILKSRLDLANVLV